MSTKLVFLLMTYFLSSSPPAEADLVGLATKVGGFATPDGKKVDLTSREVRDQDLTPEMVAHTEVLILRDTFITDAAANAIGNGKKLRKLDLGNTEWGDKGMKVLRNFPQLEYLDLSDTPITDQGTVHLLACPQLRTVKMSRTRVSNATLQYLNKLYHARSRLSLRGNF